jgi:phage protein D
MSVDLVAIHPDQDFYVPAFKVLVGNQILRGDVIRDVISVSYTDNLEQVDSFEMVINNWDARSRDFKYIDRRLFDPGQKVALWMGYFGKAKSGRERMRLMLTGEITSLRPSFPSGGQPTLTISGLNQIHGLRTGQNSFAYADKTDSQIAKDIGQRLGMEVETDPTAEAAEQPYKYLIQPAEYAISYLIKRAQKIGYDLFIRESETESPSNGDPPKGKLYFGPSRAVQREIFKLKYGRSLIDFQPDLNVANQVCEVKYNGWDAVRKKPIRATSRCSDLTTNRNVGGADGQTNIDAAFGGRTEVISTRPVHSQEEAETMTRETHETIRKRIMTGSGSTVGVPDLRAGSLVLIEGVGKRFSGKYFLTSTTHKIDDSGYTTRFTGRREEITR